MNAGTGGVNLLIGVSYVLKATHSLRCHLMKVKTPQIPTTPRELCTTFPVSVYVGETGKMLKQCITEDK